MNRDNLLLSTHNKPNHDIRACMPARTYSSSFLLAPQAVSHPSIHVTERWVHPVTGQLVAVTLIYVAPLSSLFLLWWKDCIYVCMHARSLLGRFTQLVMGAGVGAQSDRSGEKSPCVSKLHDGFLPGNRSKGSNPKGVELNWDCAAATRIVQNEPNFPGGVAVKKHNFRKAMPLTP